MRRFIDYYEFLRGVLRIVDEKPTETVNSKTAGAGVSSSDKPSMSTASTDKPPVSTESGLTAGELDEVIARVRKACKWMEPGEIEAALRSVDGGEKDEYSKDTLAAGLRKLGYTPLRLELDALHASLTPSPSGTVQRSAVIKLCSPAPPVATAAPSAPAPAPAITSAVESEPPKRKWWQSVDKPSIDVKDLDLTGAGSLTSLPTGNTTRDIESFLAAEEDAKRAAAHEPSKASIEEQVSVTCDSTHFA